MASVARWCHEIVCDGHVSACRGRVASVVWPWRACAGALRGLLSPSAPLSDTGCRHASSGRWRRPF
eukprot:3760619-Lingulodinium_polyedra.AAC.1